MKGECLGKIPYYSPKNAAKAIVKAKDREGLILDFYKCTQCKWWHLTSKVAPEPKEDYE